MDGRQDPIQDWYFIIKRQPPLNSHLIVFVCGIQSLAKAGTDNNNRSSSGRAEIYKRIKADIPTLSRGNFNAVHCCKKLESEGNVVFAAFSFDSWDYTERGECGSLTDEIASKATQKGCLVGFLIGRLQQPVIKDKRKVTQRNTNKRRKIQRGPLRRSNRLGARIKPDAKGGEAETTTSQSETITSTIATRNPNARENARGTARGSANERQNTSAREDNAREDANNIYADPKIDSNIDTKGNSGEHSSGYATGYAMGHNTEHATGHATGHVRAKEKQKAEYNQHVSEADLTDEYKQREYLILEIVAAAKGYGTHFLMLFDMFGMFAGCPAVECWALKNVLHFYYFHGFSFGRWRYHISVLEPLQRQKDIATDGVVMHKAFPWIVVQQLSKDLQDRTSCVFWKKWTDSIREASIFHHPKSVKRHLPENWIPRHIQSIFEWHFPNEWAVYKRLIKGRKRLRKKPACRCQSSSSSSLLFSPTAQAIPTLPLSTLPNLPNLPNLPSTSPLSTPFPSPLTTQSASSDASLSTSSPSVSLTSTIEIKSVPRQESAFQILTVHVCQHFKFP